MSTTSYAALNQSVVRGLHLGLILALSYGCSREHAPAEPVLSATERAENSGGAEPQHARAESPRATDPFGKKRQELIQVLERKGITDERVLSALARVPRHELVPEAMRSLAYEDRPLPIGEGQTISQPFIVALMSELANVEPGDKVLEVGTGSGYQAAVLGQLAGEVFTIEIVEPLGVQAKRDLNRLGLAENIHFRIGDGYAGWPQEAPFDAILVTAAPPSVPQPLVEQLKVGGILVIPVGEFSQELRVLEKTPRRLVERAVIPVRFVPMTGKAQE